MSMSGIICVFTPVVTFRGDVALIPSKVALISVEPFVTANANPGLAPPAFSTVAIFVFDEVHVAESVTS